MEKPTKEQMLYSQHCIVEALLEWITDGISDTIFDTKDISEGLLKASKELAIVRDRMKYAFIKTD